MYIDFRIPAHPYQTTQDEVKRTSHKIPAQNYPYNFFPNVTQQASSFQRFDRPTPFQQGVFNDSKKSSPNGFLQRIYSVSTFENMIEMLKLHGIHY